MLHIMQQLHNMGYDIHRVTAQMGSALTNEAGSGQRTTRGS